MRDLILMGMTAVLCILSPLNQKFGLYGYFWFALMRPDILAWSGANRYSLFIAASALFSNMGRVLPNLPVLIRNPICRVTILLFLVITLSVPLAVKPELCYDPYSLFVRMLVMALLIPLAIREEKELQGLVLVVACSIGLLGGKMGFMGLIAGGARYAQGYGGMMSDNNSLALALAMAVPLCWYSRSMVTAPWAKLGLTLLSLCSVGAVVFTHSRGGALAVGTTLLLVAWRAKHRVLVGLMVVGFFVGAAYLVRESFLSRMATIAEANEEASAKSRIILASSAIKMWLDYPLFGVGFTESNERELISNYVPSEYKEEYKGKVIHNTYLQMLVDSGPLALLPYCWLLFGTIWRMEKFIVRSRRSGDMAAAAIPLAVQTALVTYAVGSTFLSRTSFDFFYILIMIAAAWLEIENGRAVGPTVEMVGSPVMASLRSEDSEPARTKSPVEDKPWMVDPQAKSRFKMGRERRERS